MRTTTRRRRRKHFLVRLKVLRPKEREIVLVVSSFFSRVLVSGILKFVWRVWSRFCCKNFI